MAKFTVFFKDKPIQTNIFETGVIHIGRDETNEITVDSLAVAPIHAVAILGDNSCIIKQLNENYPLIVNGEKTKEHPLINGNRISIGKHAIVFNTTETISTDKQDRSTTTNDFDFLPETASNKLPEANLQIMSGKHIGRVIPLKKPMTRLGRGGDGIVVITKRKEGYFISALESDNSLTVNQQPLGDNTLKLNHNDLVIIDKNPMQFFII
jgi:FHA domain-containing protein